MFCTICAARNAADASECAACGARIGPWSTRQRDIPTSTATGPSGRLPVLRALYTLPIVVVLIVAGLAAAQRQARQVDMAAAYARGVAAAALRDFPTAVDSFAAAGDWRDAATRRAEAAAALQPFRVAAQDGLAALERGDAERAIDLLAPVARILPTYDDAASRLADARVLRVRGLNDALTAAQTRHDWMSAESALHSILMQGDAGDAAQKLATIEREHGPLILGRDRGLWLAGLDGADDQLITDRAPVVWPSWSPDRTRVAFLSYDPDDPSGKISLCLVNVDGSGFRILATDVSAHAPPVWSPDGQRIAYTSFAAYDPVADDGPISIRYYDLPARREVDVTGDRFPLAFNPAWSPDGTRLAFVAKERTSGERPQEAAGDVMVARVGGDSFANLTDGRVRDVWSVAWNPVDDQMLVYSLFGQAWYEPPTTRLRTLDPRTGALEIVDHGDETLGMPQWSPDGARYAYTRGEHTLVIVADGVSDALNLPIDLSGDLSWSPDSLALLALPVDSSQPTQLVALDHGDAIQATPLTYDADRPFYAPPQWAPATPPRPAGPPTIGDVGLDRSGRR